jgi:hypothetical protein
LYFRQLDFFQKRAESSFNTLELIGLVWLTIDLTAAMLEAGKLAIRRAKRTTKSRISASGNARLIQP